MLFGCFVESAMKVGLPGPFLHQTKKKKKVKSGIVLVMLLNMTLTTNIIYKCVSQQEMLEEGSAWTRTNQTNIFLKT